MATKKTTKKTTKKPAKRSTSKRTPPRIWRGARQLEKLLIPIEQLREDPQNARRHDDRNLQAIEASLTAFGQVKPVVARPLADDPKHVQLVAGAGTRHAALELGWTHLAVVVDQFSDKTARAYGIADNRTADLASWDMGNLSDALADLDDMHDAMGFTDAEIEQLAGLTDDAVGDAVELGTVGEEQDADRDDATPATTSSDQAEPVEDEPPMPEPPKEPRTKFGDVWQLGTHRLLCGDSLEEPEEGPPRVAAHLGQVDAVVTDPPYAIYGSSSGIASDIADDKMVRPFFRSLGNLLRSSLKPFGHFYTFTDWRSWSSLWEAFRGRLVVQNCLVWSKGGGLGHNYLMAHELIAFGANLPPQNAMSKRETGMRPVRVPNVFEFSRVTGDERHHNASKPVPLLEQLVRNSTDDNQIVAEPFGGGGSTLIACERAGRVCRAVEIEPAWCDVIVQRWETLTGRKAELVEREEQ